MKKALTALMLSATLIGTTALAAEDATSVTRMENNIHDNPVVIDARAGLLTYANGAEDIMAGLTANWNLQGMFTKDFPLHYGLTTGVYFSPLDEAGEDTNTWIVPLNAFAGATVADKIFVNAMGGVQYFLDGDDALVQGDEFVPNLGGELGYSISENVAISGRAGWTFADGENPFMATLGVSFGMA